MNLGDRENITIKSIKNIGLTIGFVMLLIFPTIQKYFPVFPELESTENRQLASKPIIQYHFLDPVPKLYEDYYNDHFSLRNQLVHLKSLLIAKTLNKSPMPEFAIFGKDDWIYLVDKELDTYRGKNLLKQADMDKISNEMIRRKKYLDYKNISLYFVIIPTKYTIYPEYLPNNIDKLSRTNSTDLVKDALFKSGIDVLDLRDELIHFKSEDLLYYKTDNHWNDLGSFYASKIIIDKIKKDYLNIPTLNLDNYSIKLENVHPLMLIKLSLLPKLPFQAGQIPL